MKAALTVVGSETEPSIEAVARQSVQRRAWLRRELAAEEARLTVLRRRLATERGVSFIRVEAMEQEFGGC